jgi:hypothetical protein
MQTPGRFVDLVVVTAQAAMRVTAKAPSDTACHGECAPPIGLSGSLPDRGHSWQCGHYRHAHGRILLRQLEFLAAFFQLPSDVVTSPDL